mgnify:CR=1 FL=1
MNEILAIALQSMQADIGRLDRVAMNLAHAQTPGYKRELQSASFSSHMVAAHAAQATQATPAAQGVAEDATSPSPAAAAPTYIDHRPGALQATGQKLDLAIAGAGWFEVPTPEVPAYTRNGAFQLDAQGRLVTASGRHPVMGTDGEIRLSHGAPVIDARGRVFEGALPGAAPSRNDGVPLAQLKLVQLDDKLPVRRIGDGLVVTDASVTAINESQAEIRQGHLENANVSTLHETLQLMQAMRHVETMQKVALGYDEMLGAALRKLGETA